MITLSLRDLADVLRRLPIIRETIVGAEPRDILPSGQIDMNVCLGWSRKHFHRDVIMGMNVHRRRGLVHVTLCAHEQASRVHARLTKNRGFGLWRGPYTHRFNIGAFIFVLSIEWCHTKNFERINGPLFNA